MLNSILTKPKRDYDNTLPTRFPFVTQKIHNK